MEVKKFEAPTLAEALQVVKKELGPEAVVLSTKNKKSAFGLMNKSSVEVTAAINPQALEKKLLAEQNMSEQQKSRLANLPAQKVVQAYDILSGSRMARQMRSEIEARKSVAAMTNSMQSTDRFLRAKTESQHSASVPRTPTQRKYIDITDDDSPAETMTTQTLDRTHVRTASASSANPAAAKSYQAPAREPEASKRMTMQQGNVLPKILSDLIEAGVDSDMVRDLGDELKSIMLREHLVREDVLRLQMARVLMSRVRVGRSLMERTRLPGNPRIITFVGPTGVGKTTTVAKIAAELVLAHKRPVTLATTDTYKIAAVEQLQTYANILKIPLEVCPTPESLENLNLQAGPDEIILVDTAGYGPRDQKKLQELSHFFAGVRTEIHLCLSATTRDRDLADVTKRFKIFDPDFLVITKMDETDYHGNILNMGAKSLLPLSYFTMGQRVPEDIEVATKERVADLILKVSGGI